VPVAILNNTATQDAYVDALTVVFGFPRHAFSLNVFNAAIYYKVGAINQGDYRGGNVNWETQEHYLAPSLSTFDDPTMEGFPSGYQFAGIQVRSAATGVPARVTVA
jgi:hypothetical protein